MSITADLKTAASRLRLAREKRDLTVKQLAEKAGVTPQVIYHAEAGHNFLSMPAYKRVHEALGFGRPALL